MQTRQPGREARERKQTAAFPQQEPQDPAAGPRNPAAARPRRAPGVVMATPGRPGPGEDEQQAAGRSRRPAAACPVPAGGWARRRAPPRYLSGRRRGVESSRVEPSRAEPGWAGPQERRRHRAAAAGLSSAPSWAAGRHQQTSAEFIQAARQRRRAPKNRLRRSRLPGGASPPHA